MNLFTQKITSLLVYPLTQSLLLVLLGVVLILLKRYRSSVFSILLGASWLVVCSLPVTANWLQQKLESGYPIVATDSLPSAGAIVVLGGALASANVPNAYPNLHSSGDRVLTAARLYHAGKAPNILISAGKLPWVKLRRTEAYGIQRILLELGVPEEDIIIESGSASTIENATLCYELLQPRGVSKILLVTSAWHMIRAQAVFEKVGFEVIPAATDYESIGTEPYGILDYFPTAGMLERSTRSIKEYVGYWVYNFRGWI